MKADQEQYCVYLLRCSDDTLYCGITNDLSKRVAAHNAGKGAKYTRGRRPVSVEKIFLRENKSEALKLERRIKKMSRQAKLDYKEDK
jgi:putative endonuclease